LVDRGLLKVGYFADIAVFDANTIEDTATYTRPSSVSKGVKYVFVNGQLEFENGKLTEAMAGQALRGPGWKHEAAGN
jgi:N-acyl-D-amino-acid deacylase